MYMMSTVTERGILSVEQLCEANGVFLARNQHEIRQELLDNRCDNYVSFLFLHRLLIIHTVGLIVQFHFATWRSYNIAAPLLPFIKKLYSETNTRITRKTKYCTHPFSGRCQGGPNTGPAVARTFTVEPSSPRISDSSPGSRYVTYHRNGLCKLETE